MPPDQMSDGLCPPNMGCNCATVCLCAMIEDLREQLAAARREENEACQKIHDDLTREAWTDWDGGYEGGIEAYRDAIRARVSKDHAKKAVDGSENK
jgi:hypothetical protein